MSKKKLRGAYPSTKKSGVKEGSCNDIADLRGSGAAVPNGK